MKRIVYYGFGVGFPFSLLYAWSAMNGRSLGLAMHSVFYVASVYPLGFAYAAGIGLCFLRRPGWAVFKWIAAPGRMALTNYIGQSFCGMVLFYGIGLGFGAEVGLACVVWIAAGVYLLQALFSRFWLHYFQFGPLEWIWRMLTYGRFFRLLKDKNT